MDDQAEDRFHGKLDAPQCWMCTRNPNRDKCDAFPDGVPLIIQTNEFDHRRPFPGDNGIRFSPVDDNADALNKQQWDVKISRWKWLMEDDQQIFDDERRELKANIEKYGPLWAEEEDGSSG